MAPTPAAKCAALHTSQRSPSARPEAAPRLRVLSIGGRCSAMGILALGLTVAGSAHSGEAKDPLSEIKTLIAAGRYAEAELGARATLTSVEKQFGADSTEAAGVLEVLVEALLRSGKLDEPETRALAERAVAIRERTFVEGDPQLAVSLGSLATLDYMTGDYLSARRLFERALAVREKALGPDHIDVAKSLNNLALLLTQMGDYAPARPLFDRSLAIREKVLGPDHPGVAATLNNLAILQRATGNLAEARRLYERSLAYHEKSLGPEHPTVAQTLNNLALVLEEMGDHEPARKLYERALAIAETALGPDHPDVATYLTNLALLLENLDDVAAARPMAERALAIYEKTLGPENPTVATNLTLLATLFEDTGDYAAARPLLERALAIDEKTLEAGHPLVASASEQLAFLFSEMDDYVGARTLYERASAIYEKALGPDHPYNAGCLSHLAMVQIMQGDRAGALESALEAERVARNHLRLTAGSLSERQALRYAAVRTSGLHLALTLAAQGLDDAGRRRVLDALVRSRAVVFDEMAARHRAAASVTDPGIARRAEALSRARSHLANLEVHGLGNLTPESYRQLLDEARNERDEAERALAAVSAGFAREFSRGRVGIDEVAASLPAGSALVAIVRYVRSDPVAKNAAAADAAPRQAKGENGAAGRRPERSLKLDDVPSYLAFVLRPGEPSPTLVSLGPAVEIDAAVARWRKEASSGPLTRNRTLKEGEAAYRLEGEALRRIVWDPLDPVIADCTRVFLVPDGSLNLVNMDALPAPDHGYLVERGQLVQYVSTERDLVRSGETRLGEGMMVIGRPAYDAASMAAGPAPGQGKPGPAPFAQAPGKGRRGASTVVSEPIAPMRSFRGERSACGDFQSIRFEPIPGSGREADEVGRLWTEKTHQSLVQLTGPAASETAVKQKGPGRRVLHLATHGFFLDGRCPSALDESGPPEGPPSDALKTPPPATGDSPLLLSGLALAGANRRASAGPDDEDGVLTAEEVAAMNLSGVDWVVLSACDTGVGEIIPGEGMFGLRRSFQLAGARTVITSLWSLEDEATRHWMRSLYQGRLGGASTAEAVRNASREMIKSLKRTGLPAHPYYWGAFVAVGD